MMDFDLSCYINGDFHQRYRQRLFTEFHFLAFRRGVLGVGRHQMALCYFKFQAIIWLINYFM